MISVESVTQWLEAYKAAWLTQSPEAVVDLFTEDGKYFETPFLVHVGRDAIYAYWKSAPVEQSGISFSYTILHVYDSKAIVHWNADFIKEGDKRDLDGMFLFDFDANHKCKTLREWWHSKRTPLNG